MDEKRSRRVWHMLSDITTGEGERRIGKGVGDGVLQQYKPRILLSTSFPQQFSDETDSSEILRSASPTVCVL